MKSFNDHVSSRQRWYVALGCLPVQVPVAWQLSGERLFDTESEALEFALSRSMEAKETAESMFRSITAKMQPQK